MTTVRRINQSQVRGNNNNVLPAGTIMAYEVNGEYVLRVHDGVTLGGVPFPNAPSIVHDNDVNIIINGGDSSTYTWNFGQTGTLTAPGMAVFGGTDGIALDDVSSGVGAIFNNKDVYITGGESLRFTQLNDDEGNATSVLRFWNTGNTRWDGNNDESELATIRVGNDAQENDPVQGFIVLAPEDQENGDALFKFSSNGSLTFPDGTTQTTAYTGQSSGATDTFFVIVNESGEVSKSTDGVSWTVGADTGAGINRVATNGVTVAMIQSDQLSWTTFAGLEASTYVSGSIDTADQIGGETVDWNQIDYAGGYFVAVGRYTPTGSSFEQGVYGYSTDGRSWTFETVDQTVVEFFANDPVDSNWQFSDVDYNGVGWMFSVSDINGGDVNGGGVYITDLTAPVTSARCFSMNITNRAAWNGSAWYMEGGGGPGDGNLAGVNSNLDPRNGTFEGPIDPWATAIQDLGIDAGSTNELAGGNGYIAASDSDGHVAWSDDNGQTWQIVTPIPYTRTISSITQANPAVVTSSGENGESGEKVVISGSSVSGYNGTFYWKSADSSLYTDQALTTPLDTSGLAPFTGTATLTWSNGQYIDAMDYINGYFYIGNDDEQIARTTDFVSWTIVDDQANDFDYWNDIAGFVGTGGGGSGLTSNNDINITVNSEDSSSYTWNFGQTGVLTFPSGNMTMGDLDGVEGIRGGVDSTIGILSLGTGGASVLQWVDDLEEATAVAAVVVNSLFAPNTGTVQIITGDVGPVPEHSWTFGPDGDLVLPPGGDIKDSEGNSVLGGATGDANVWVQTFETQSGAPTDIVSLAISVEYDSAGNVIALFNHFNDDGGGSYYSVGKYTTAGVKIWTARFDDEFYTDGWGLAVDNDTDSIYVAGETDVEGQDNATLTKIDAADGSIIWSKTYDFGFNSQSSVVDVASDGNPVMVGYASNGSDNYVATTKVDAADGSVIWSRALDGQGYEEAYGMAVGPSGEVVAIGLMEQLGVTDAAATLYTDPVSNANWTINQTGVLAGALGFDVSFAAGVPTFANISDTAGGRTVDGTVATILGSVLGGADGTDDMVVKVATLATNEPDDRMLVVKYDSAGSIQWQKAILFDAGFDCRGADADIDSAGNIYVTGSYQYSFESGTTSALSILKLDGTGAKQWSRRVTGDCDTFGVSVVVGADDKLYLSAMTGNNANSEYTWVAAKYGIDGTVEWQRLIDNTTGWSFTGGIFFADGGGSNIAVKQDYVVLGGGFGDLPNGGEPQATLIQVSAAGDVFSVGDWDFKAASFSGVLNGTASDITVVNAGKTDTDNAENITTSTVTLTTEVSGFLLGTLYSTTANNRLFNGGNELVLGTTGTVTLPQGGTISEGYVTSNPTIQLTPASPEVASQKLVIKGGGNYSNTENGITVTVNNITQTVGDVINVYVESVANADQTLYWWIYPEGVGLADPGTGTVILDEFGDGNFTFELDSDDYEFTVRVSPEDNNYDPDNTGAESVLINSSAPTYEGEHHLHLTTGDLSVTSIFLGTDDHNVRTTTDGKIQITTPSEGNNVWEFDTNGELTLPTGGHIGPSGGKGAGTTYGGANDHLVSLTSYYNSGLYSSCVTAYADGTLNITAYNDGGPNPAKIWTFDNTGTLTLPDDSGIKSSTNIDITIDTPDSSTFNWRFGADGDLTFPDNTVQTTAYTGSTLTTVAKTGIAYNTGTATALSDATYSVPIVDGNYGPFTLSGVTFTVVVTSGVAAYTVTATTGNSFVGEGLGFLNASDLGGASGNSSAISVADVVQGVTAIDLTKTINKLTDGYYSLADGVEGQIMYVVRQNGSTAANISVVVANARWDGGLFPDQLVVPFQIPFTDMVTIIFTDGAWQSSTFGSLT
jgi:hypothetical protein